MFPSTICVVGLQSPQFDHLNIFKLLKPPILLGALEHEFYFSIYIYIHINWEFHHPN